MVIFLKNPIIIPVFEICSMSPHLSYEDKIILLYSPSLSMQDTFQDPHGCLKTYLILNDTYIAIL